MVSNLWDFPKENVCLVVDLLLGEWLIDWKDSIDLRQYLSFIKIIINCMNSIINSL